MAAFLLYHTVDGSEILHHLMCGLSTIIYKVCICQVVIAGFLNHQSYHGIPVKGWCTHKSGQIQGLPVSFRKWKPALNFSALLKGFPCAEYNPLNKVLFVGHLGWGWAPQISITVLRTPNFCRGHQFF